MRLEEITPLILSYNEEANIGRTLSRLNWAQSVVLVDSYSTDRTLEIARQFRNVAVVQRAFDDHSSQWNFGLAQIATGWVLALDADFLVHTEMCRELEALSTKSVAGYSAAFRYCVAGQPLRATLYPARVVLFRKDSGIYVLDGHTQRLQISGSVGNLLTPIDHDDRKPLSAWLAAQTRYARLEAEKLATLPLSALRRNDRIRRTKWLAPLLVLPYCLFAKGLILDGWRGWYYALQRTYVELLLTLMLIENAHSN